MLSCDQHDYIEIACMYKYKVKLILIDGSTLEGVCLDTLYNETKQECIKVIIDDKQQVIQLETILKIQAITENPYFDIVDFA